MRGSQARGWLPLAIYVGSVALVALDLRGHEAPLASGAGLALVALAVGPLALALLLLVFVEDGRHEAAALMVGSFVLGGLAAAGTRSLVAALDARMAPAAAGVVLAPVEELAVLVSLWALAYHHASFESPQVGMYYGIAAGAGFAAYVNVAYALPFLPGALAGGIVQTALRLVPTLALWTGIVGLFLARAKGAIRPWRTLATGFLLACALHAAFNLVVAARAWSVLQAAFVETLAFGVSLVVLVALALA